MFIAGSNDDNRQLIHGWMAARIPGGWPKMPDDFRAIYIAEGNEPIGVVALTGWTKHSAEIHIATDGTARWATRKFLYEVYHYIFDTCGLTRINALSMTDNHAVIELHKRVGHTYEGLLKHQYGYGKHALLFGMTTDDWKCSKWNRTARPPVNKVLAA